MNWEAIAAVSEAVGAAGVIASLLYLAVQVRSSTRASAVESKLVSSRMYTDFLGAFIQSPELNALFVRGRKSLEDLSPEEYIRFSNLALQSFSFFSAGYFQFLQGTLSDEDWFENVAVIRFWLRGKGSRDWWDKLGKRMFGPRFVGFIEAEMSRLEGA